MTTMWLTAGLMIAVIYILYQRDVLKCKDRRIERLDRENSMNDAIYNRLNYAFMDAEELINDLKLHNDELTLENSKMQEELKQNRKPKSKNV